MAKLTPLPQNQTNRANKKHIKTDEESIETTEEEEKQQS